MKYKAITSALIVILSSIVLSEAQVRRSAVPSSIFEALEGRVPGEGIVIIEQSAELKSLVGGVSALSRGILGREGNTTLLQGYRIQVYNGNLPSSKAEAERRASMIRRIVSEHKVYINYNPPFWRLVMGDFVTGEAAKQARTRLMKLMPDWFRESYVVADKVRILNYNPEEYE